MIGRLLVFGAAAALSLALVACGEKPQAMDVAAKKADAEPWTTSNAANSAFYAPGWKVGDKTAWEEQMRQRNRAQNDYVR